jgi:hypothetical protein
MRFQGKNAGVGVRAADSFCGAGGKVVRRKERL